MFHICEIIPKIDLLLETIGFQCNLVSHYNIGLGFNEKACEIE